jgi:GTPase SAR1 family protein
MRPTGMKRNTKPKTLKDESEERWVRIAVIGTPQSGKTSLINRLISEKHTPPEKGAVPEQYDFKGPLSQAASPQNVHKHINLHIHDTASSGEAYDNLWAKDSPNSLTKVDVIMVVFNAKTLRGDGEKPLMESALIHIIDKLHREVQDKPILLVGNQVSPRR